VIKKYTRSNSNSSSNGGGVNEENNNYDGKPQPPQQHHKPIQISFDISRRGEEHKHENINIYAAKMILNLFGRRGKKEMILSKLSSLLHHPVLLLSSTNNLRPLLPKIFFSTLNILLLTYSCDCSPCLSSYSTPYTTDTTPMLFHQLQQKDGVDDDDIDDDCNCSNNTNWLSNLFRTKKTPSIIVGDTTAVNTSLQSSSSSSSRKTTNTTTTSTTTTASRKYALKSLVQPDDDALIELRNEVSILRSLDHPHIAHVVDVYDCTTRKKNSSKNMKLMMYLVLDLCEGGDLYVHDPYTEVEARSIVRQLLRSVGYMHRRGIVHRDLKYENVMFTTVTPIKTISTTTTIHDDGGGPKYYDKGKLEIKVIDFGLSKKYGKRVDMADTLMNDFVGTIYTMAPEVIKGDYTL
jgi:tRNA A-37 threonylcarbamoyl transferase component Bud32